MMQTRPFGKTGPLVSEIGFGAWGIAGGPRSLAYGPTNDAESIVTLHRAVTLGVTFVDTASFYGFGQSEALIARAEIRDRIFLATKCGIDWSSGKAHKNWTPEFLRQSVEDSLKRLKTEYVDLIQLHNPKAEEMGALEVLKELKRAGKARFIGVSIHTEEEALAAMDAGAESVQLVYNYLNRSHRERTLPEAAARGVAVIAREPLCRGILTGKFTRNSTFPPQDVRSHWPKEKFHDLIGQVDTFLAGLEPGVSPVQAALRFVLAAPEVSVVIPGAKKPAQVEENCSASTGGTPR